MADIKKWALIISVVSIVSGILNALLPESKMKQVYKTFSAVVLIYSVLLPLINSDIIDFKIDDYLEDNYEVSEKMDKYAEQTVVRSAEKAIEDLLNDSAAKKKIDCKFEVQCKVTEGKIVVSSVTVSEIDAESQKSIVTDIVMSLGFDKEIITYPGENDEH